MKDLIKEMETLKTKFHKFGGSFMGQLMVIYDVSDFNEWKNKVMQYIDNNKCKNKNEIMHLLTKKWSGFHDKRDFDRLYELLTNELE